MTRKSAVIIFLLAAFCLPALTPVLAQEASTPEDVVKNFYQWYLQSLNANEDPFEKRKANMKESLTQRLMTALDRARKRPEGLDADFFLDAQDWDETWVNNVSTTKATIQGATATVPVTLEGDTFGEHKLRVGLKKVAATWRIDSVNGRANP